MKNRNKSTTFIDISYTHFRVFFILSTLLYLVVETKKTVPFKTGLFIVFLLKLLISIAKDFVHN